MYLEDGIGGGSSLREAERISSEIPIDLEKLGFLVAIEKCHWEPTQKLEWLGLSQNIQEIKVRVSKCRIEKLEKKHYQSTTGGMCLV